MAQFRLKNVKPFKDGAARYECGGGGAIAVVKWVEYINSIKLLAFQSIFR
jgi:hypothetical protein